MILAIPYFEATGLVHQDVGDILQVIGSGSSPILIGDVGHDPTHWKYNGRILTSDGLQIDGETTAEGRRQELDVNHSGCIYGIGRSEGGVHRCQPPPEHGHTVHRYLSDHGSDSRGGEAPWKKGFKEVVVTWESVTDGGTGGDRKGSRDR